MSTSNQTPDPKGAVWRVFHGISTWGEDYLPGIVYWPLILVMTVLWVLWIVGLWTVLPPDRLAAWKDAE